MAKRIYANERKNNIFEKKVMPENNIYYATLKTRHGYWWLRRFQDILFSLIAIIVLSPVMLITVISIIIDDPKGGPVFSQIRVGKNGKEFKMYKFRSMVVDAEDRLKELLEENEMDGPVFKIADDPRITRVGKFIRKTSIDELPQLFNVLKGDMSLIGPRPERPFFVDKFKEEIPRYMIKHQVRPGMTGWAQVNGLRGDTSIRKRIELDLFYIENWSVSFDIRILFLTVFKGFVNKNAY